MLEGKKLVKRFGGLVALNKVDFFVEKGKIVGLIGPNGSGKTTLFNVITGFYPPDQGALNFKGQSTVGKKPHQIANMGIGRTFQIVKPFLSMTVQENVAVAALFGREKLKDVDEASLHVKKWIDFCRLTPKIDTLTSELTLVEMKRLEMARALAVKPEIVLLDEPLAGLNPVEMNQALETIERIRSELKITVFIIEHRISAVMKICDNIIVLHHGANIAQGSPQEVVNSPSVIEAYLGKPL